MSEKKVRELIERCRDVKKRTSDRRIIDDIDEIQIYLNGILKVYGLRKKD